MSLFALLENAVVVFIGIIITLQIIVIISSAIGTRFRRQRAHLSFGKSLQPSVLIGKHQVKVFTYGKDLYQSILKDIDNAKESICIESFIWKGDKTGSAIKNAITQRAKEGLPVYVIFDGFANLVVPNTFKQFAPEVHILVYRSWRRFFDMFDPRRLARDHRKIIVIDRKISYVGGYNIGDLYGEKWRDTHARIEGPAAQNLFAAYTDFWNENVTKRHFPLLPSSASIIPNIRLYLNHPGQLKFPIRSLYIDAIDFAKHQINLTTAYFIPDRFILEALLQAAERGVTVNLLIPETSNHLLADWLARTYFTECLQKGIHIYLYQDAMIHAKTMTIDGEWTTIGTANLDRLSLAGNYEINVEFIDHRLAKAMESIFENDLAHCKKLSLSEWTHRPLLQKLGELVLSPLWPFL